MRRGVLRRQPGRPWPAGGNSPRKPSRRRGWRRAATSARVWGAWPPLPSAGHGKRTCGLPPVALIGNGAAGALGGPGNGTVDDMGAMLVIRPCSTALVLAAGSAYWHWKPVRAPCREGRIGLSPWPGNPSPTEKVVTEAIPFRVCACIRMLAQRTRPGGWPGYMPHALLDATPCLRGSAWLCVPAVVAAVALDR